MAYNETPGVVAALLANINLANGLVQLNGSGQIPSGLLPGSTAITGVSNGVNASAGQVGEVMTADLPSGSAISISNSTATNITSVTLTAGDWDCRGSAVFVPTVGTTLFGLMTASLSTTTGTLPTGLETDGFSTTNSSVQDDGVGASLIVGSWQFNVSAPTTIYLVGVVEFSLTGGGGGGSCVAFGSIQCRRMR